MIDNAVIFFVYRNRCVKKADRYYTMMVHANRVSVPRILIDGLRIALTSECEKDGRWGTSGISINLPEKVARNDCKKGGKGLDM